jgi:hypothetical protein
VLCQWKCASSLLRRLFNRSGLTINIPWNWWQNCKRTALSWLLKECTVCNLYGCRFRSLNRMCHTLLSDMPIAWACLCADRLGLWPKDANIQAMFSGMQTEDSWPSGFLHMKEPSTCHCLTQQPTAFGNGVSCWLSSQREICTESPQINSSTAQTCSLTPQSSVPTYCKEHCFSLNTCTQYPGREAWN